MKMELVVLDESFQSVAVIDSYKSLIWADRYNEYEILNYICGWIMICLSLSKRIIICGAKTRSM